MNQIVLIALRRPYTFVVLAILILVFGASWCSETPTDVFPVIQIPVSSVVWIYDNLMPADVEGRITYVFERDLTSDSRGHQIHLEQFVIRQRHHQCLSSGRRRSGWQRSRYRGDCADDCQGTAAGY